MTAIGDYSAADFTFALEHVEALLGRPDLLPSKVLARLNTYRWDMVAEKERRSKGKWHAGPVPDAAPPDAAPRGDPSPR